MELTWKRLLQILQTISEKCLKLIELARRQREAIMHEQIQVIGELVIEQEEEIKSFQALEQEREALVQGLWQEFNLVGKEQTISNLLPLVPPDWSNDYRMQVERLRRQFEEVRRENEINRRLLNQSQQFVAWLMSYLVTPEGAMPVYTNTGINHQQAYFHIVNQNM